MSDYPFLTIDQIPTPDTAPAVAIPTAQAGIISGPAGLFESVYDIYAKTDGVIATAIKTSTVHIT